MADEKTVNDQISVGVSEKQHAALSEKYQHLSEKVHNDTMYFVNGLVHEFDLYPEIIDDMRKGKGVVELRKRVLLRAIDEAWVTAIEDSLTALDELIRKPSHFIEENERILPIELTKSVSNRSIKHLAQHTDYISKVEGDTVIPSKLLNVFRDETNQTYENKFVNTLLNRLFVFVRRRYDAAVEAGQDVKNTSLDFSNEFSHGEVKGKLHLRVELEEPPKEGEVEKNYVFTSDLWRRVEKLNRICTDYMSSAFVNDMGKSYVNPPIMRTNAILKNKSLRQCLYLWEFIESYENIGFSTIVEDTLLDVDETYIRELYSTMAMEYLLFRHRTDKGFDADDELASSTVDEPIRPEIVEDLTPATAADFAVHIQAIDQTRGERTAEQTEILKELEIALLADEVMRRRIALEDARDGYEYSLMARLVLAQEPAQSFYTQLKNLLLSYQGVKSRISWNHDNYTLGKKPCARLAVKGKTLCIYLPLNPLDEKYSKFAVIDKSGVAAYKNRPFCLRVRSRRALNQAVTLVQEVMQKLSAKPIASPQVGDYHYPLQTREELLKQGLMRLRGKKQEKTQQEGRNFNSNAFMAKLVLAQEPAQTYYTELKNRLLSYRKVKSRVSWKYDSFNCGRTLCARVAIRGKTIVLCLPLDPADVDQERFRTEDMSGRAQYNQTPVVLKIRSALALKRALELVDMSMQKLGLEQMPNAVEKDYRQKLLDKKELIAKGWIKVANNGGTARFGAANAEKKAQAAVENEEQSQYGDAENAAENAVETVKNNSASGTESVAQTLENGAESAENMPKIGAQSTAESQEHGSESTENSESAENAADVRGSDADVLSAMEAALYVGTQHGAHVPSNDAFADGISYASQSYGAATATQHFSLGYVGANDQPSSEMSANQREKQQSAAEQQSTNAENATLENAASEKPQKEPLPFLTNEDDLVRKSDLADTDEDIVGFADQVDEIAHKLAENQNDEPQEESSFVAAAEVVDGQFGNQEESQTLENGGVNPDSAQNSDQTSAQTPNLGANAAHLDEAVIFDAQIDGDFALLNKPHVAEEKPQKEGFFQRLFGRNKNKNKDENNKDE